MRGWLVLLAACGRIDFDPGPLGPLARDATTPVGPDATIPDRVLFLPFDNTYNDLGNQRMGVCDPNCPSFAPGHDATGVKFDGTQCLRYDDLPAFDTPSFTIAVWVDSIAYAHGTYLEKSYKDTTTTDNSWQLWSDDGNNVQFATYAAGPVNDPLFYQKPAAQPWQFFVATFDGTTKKLYVDGVEKASGVGTGPIGYDAGAIRIGCDYDSGAPNTFVTGSLDDVFVYTRALSAAEVVTLTGM